MGDLVKVIRHDNCRVRTDGRITLIEVKVNEQDAEELLLSLISEIYLYKWRGVTKGHVCFQKTRPLELKLTV
jgi:galactokinase